MNIPQMIVLAIAVALIGFIGFFGARDMSSPAGIYAQDPELFQDSGGYNSAKAKIASFFDGIQDFMASYQRKTWSDENRKLDQNVRFQVMMGMVLKVLAIIVITTFVYVFLEVQKSKL